MKLAPGRFSTMTGVCSTSPSLLATKRACESEAPPAASPSTMRMLRPFSGKAAGEAASEDSGKATAPIVAPRATQPHCVG
jgi:hypothetical protein